MSKVAVSSQGKELESQVDPRFGRAAYFLVVDTDSMDFVVLDNTQTRGMSHGAGIQAAEMVSKAGATALLSGVVGPKAWSALEAAGVAIIQDARGTVAEAVEDYKNGKLKTSQEPQGMMHTNQAPMGGGGGRGMGGGGGRGMGGGGGRGMGGGRK
ncbi:NifB/NifX family molybdenum-iron cluster-binding protein [Dethiosulfatarculus sandiegensis]|uniref:Dinitrogenase iron-molybdenum cofactor biosynthesis protein n=1 Tax=Dethiosulfatarculus sandiegensis TaxID=1429043 RepID=A0A0D2J8Y8_9BACT|nr:NifB/NifX family molybdenum-iron cluster-binding protein [Dethiosulfatarculus sandiegensis]KIX12196.1 dinitrogenase iron-molybdenum cofactor biosynthesis protein [Dethiosulfatarculus sandiegensis]